MPAIGSVFGSEDLRPPRQRRLTQDRLDIRGYIDTARKHGQNAIAVLHDLARHPLATASTGNLPVTTQPEPAPHHRVNGLNV